ncbi:hypothetical protein H7K28_15075 [Paenibacillus polymyxa]|jgi:chromosome segregation ATPase|uniref:hypothetical protein n=1 Tax=Paenibacillus polymyxa TaxID=1406 RepID=UPI00157FC932|nr:hypothetical protein [Paenibacillus polymyxa]MBY0024531.1 hypothetical protein [Paenibacillus polymyxa]MBY0058659.1 hypothetical protein [Paenibacillus polymyxa]MBY0071245.1 hypothetical protein [Paenibacillus polymyxa]MBY0078599.1 hypothetical protein [Paenibacillus polymyxa]MBZ6441698.1 hypothetical protein [Paenibacillus polymyxa]
MTERNWQEDMDKVNAFKHARSCVNIPKYQTMPSIETPYEPLEYWLQQYAALEREYERFQQVAKGWNDDLTTAEERHAAADRDRAGAYKALEQAESLIQRKDTEIAALKRLAEFWGSQYNDAIKHGNETEKRLNVKIASLKKSIEGLRLITKIERSTRVQPEHTSFLRDKGDTP